MKKALKDSGAKRSNTLLSSTLLEIKILKLVKKSHYFEII